MLGSCSIRSASNAGLQASTLIKGTPIGTCLRPCFSPGYARIGQGSGSLTGGLERGLWASSESASGHHGGSWRGNPELLVELADCLISNCYNYVFLLTGSGGLPSLYLGWQAMPTTTKPDQRRPMNELQLLAQAVIRNPHDEVAFEELVRRMRRENLDVVLQAIMARMALAFWQGL